MARLFDDASNECVYANSAPVTEAPLTFSLWFNSDGSIDDKLVGVFQSGPATQSGFAVTLVAASNELSCWAAQNSWTYGAAIATATYTDNTWHHACGVFSATNARAIYLDGANKGTNSTSITPTGVNVLDIGGETYVGALHAAYCSGAVAELGIWSAALTDAEAATLATGVSPLQVRPASLVFYAPLWRDEDEDFVGGLSLTAYNTPSIAAHPRVIYQMPRMIVVPPASGGTTYYETPAGVTTPSSTLARLAGLSRAGTTTPSGALAKLSTKSATGVSVPTGAAARQTSKSAIGTVTPSGTLEKVRIFFRSIAGAVTPSGLLARLTGKPVAGTVSPAGVPSRSTTKSFSGSTTPTGAAIRSLLRAVSGALGLSAILDTIKTGGTQYARPDSDVTVNSWTATPLYEKIDEESYSDADYIQCNSTSYCEIGLESLTDPSSSSNHYVRYRLGRSRVDRTLTIVVRLMQGASEIASWTHTNPDISFQPFEQTLTSGEADSITDYTDLRLRFDITAIQNTQVYGQVSWAEMQVPGAPVGNLYYQSASGTTTPAGSIARLAYLVRSGAITPTSALYLLIAKAPAGTTAPSGASTRQTSKSAAGSVTPSGVLNAIKTALRSVAGALGLSGIASRMTGKGPAGSTTPSGDINRDAARSVAGEVVSDGTTARQTSKSADGSSVPAGSLIRGTLKSLAGTLNLSGILETLRTFLRSVAGILGISGAIARLTGKGAAGSTAPSGDINRDTTHSTAGSTTPSGTTVKQTSKSASGGITPSGLLNAIKTALKAVSGALGISGAISRATGKGTAGAAGAAGDISRATTHSPSGLVTPSGSPVKQTAKSMAGAFAPSGVLEMLRAFLRSVAGILGLSGATTRQTGKSNVGQIGQSGTLVRDVMKAVAGALGSAGALVRETARSIAGALGLAGILETSTGLVLQAVSGVIGLTGSVSRSTGKMLSSALVSMGVVSRRIGKRLTGVLNWAVRLIRTLYGDERMVIVHEVHASPVDRDDVFAVLVDQDSTWME